MRHSQLKHAHLVAFFKAQQGEWQAILVVQVALTFAHAVARGQRGGDHLLGTGLASTAGDGYHRPPPAPARFGGQGLQCPQRARHAQRSARIYRSFLQGSFHNGSRGPCLENGLDKIVPVVAGSRNGKEQLPGLDGAGINRIAPHRGLGHRAGDGQHLSDLGQSQVHRATPEREKGRQTPSKKFTRKGFRTPTRGPADRALKLTGGLACLCELSLPEGRFVRLAWVAQT